MDMWKTTLISSDIVSFNAKNTFIEISLKAAKTETEDGQVEVKIHCHTQSFQIINNNKAYLNDETHTSNIFSIKNGKCWFIISQVNKSLLKFLKMSVVKKC